MTAPRLPLTLQARLLASLATACLLDKSYARPPQAETDSPAAFNLLLTTINLLLSSAWFSLPDNFDFMSTSYHMTMFIYNKFLAPYIPALEPARVYGAFAKRGFWFIPKSKQTASILRIDSRQSRILSFSFISAPGSCNFSLSLYLSLRLIEV